MAKYPGLQPHYGDADGFGKLYAGSKLSQRNNAKRKQRAKHQK